MLGLGLDADAVRPLHVAAERSPTPCRRRTRAPAASPTKAYAWYVRPCRNLRSSGSWWSISSTVVTREQHEEPEVDHRVHQPGGRVAQQRVHVDAGAEVGEAALGVLASWCAGSAPACPRSQFFIRSAKRNAPHDEHHRDDRVERQLQRAGMLTNTSRWIALSLCQSVISGHDAREHGEHGDADAEADGQVVRPESGLQSAVSTRSRARHACVIVRARTLPRPHVRHASVRRLSGSAAQP